MDASFYDVGAKLNDQVFSCVIPNKLRKVGSIVHFKAANILLTIRCWCENLKNKVVLIWCDNWVCHYFQ